MSVLAISLLLLAVSADNSQVSVSLPPLLRDVGFDQRLNEQVPLDATFCDESGDSVTLEKFFHGKPVILVLAYYRCPMLCNLVLNGLTQSLRDVAFDAGQEFEVVIVSFDPRETPEIAAAKKETYVNRYGRPGGSNGWHFLTGDETPIEEVARAVGFRYRYDAQRDEYAHASGIVVLTPGGKVSRYFYDVKFAPRDVRLGLVEASHNQIGSPVDQVLLFCFHYDPAEGKYGAAIMRLVRVGGVVTLLVVTAGMWWLFRSGPRIRPEWSRAGKTEPMGPNTDPSIILDKGLAEDSLR